MTRVKLTPLEVNELHSASVGLYTSLGLHSTSPSLSVVCAAPVLRSKLFNVTVSGGNPVFDALGSGDAIFSAYADREPYAFAPSVSISDRVRSGSWTPKSLRDA